MRIFPFLLFSAIVILQKDDYVSTKPVPNQYEKSFSDDSYSSSNSRCGNNDDLLDQSSFDKTSDYYRPNQRYEVAERLPARNFNYNPFKRASNDDDGLKRQEKRQVGVIYRDDKPIGILQPYQRTYRFIAVKDEEPSMQSFDTFEQSPIAKRSVDENSYASILANFRIDSRLDKTRDMKRSNKLDASPAANGLIDFDPGDVDDLKSTIRRLRSAHPNEQIEEELKNILDDMGLIGDDEIKTDKREIKSEDRRAASNDNEDKDESLLDDGVDNNQERSKRDNNNKLATDGKNNNVEEKRNQKEETADFDNIVEKRNVDEDEDSELRSKREKAQDDKIDKGVEIKDDIPEKKESSEYEKRIEREIQQKIERLKEEVKREIAALNEKKNENRKKRATLDDGETDAVDPIKHPDAELKTLIRKRRSLDDEEESYEDLAKKKRDENESLYEEVKSDQKKSVRARRDQEDDYDSKFVRDKRMGNQFKSAADTQDNLGESLEFEDNNKNPKIQHFNKEQLCSANINNNDRDKRSGKLKLNEDFDEEEASYEDVDSNERGKREDFEYANGEEDDDGRFNEMKPRFRRRIVEEAPGENLDRPQQLSDMNDVDLFGALPKGYDGDGELSRYKRVRK